MHVTRRENRISERAKARTRDQRIGTQTAVIYVTRLDGSQFVVNADLIETVEHTADTVIILLDGKKLVVQTHVDEVVNRIIAYRQTIARGPMRDYETPPLNSAAAAIHLLHPRASTDTHHG
jgi:flagellar protein FlbD